MTRTRAYWLCQIVGWTFVAGLSQVTHPQNWAPGEIQTTLLTWVLGAAVAIGLTHAFRIVARWRGWTRLSIRQLIPRGLAASVVLGVLSEGARAGLVASGLLRLTANDRASASLATNVIGDMAVMGVWVAIYFGVHAAWNYRQAEVDRWKLQADAETARLEALKLQLNPHFFFNCLASVRALISETPRRAKKMVARLARLLRRTLQAGEEKTVPLQEELSTTETYLQLEKVRFEDRLEWDVNVSEAASGRPVPFLLVQTLAENAVKHGIGQRRDGGTISIEADVVEADATGRSGTGGEGPLRLQVTNPGRIDEDGPSRGHGRGLANARERLRLLFGDEASLELSQSGPETVAATASIPRTASAQPGGDGRPASPRATTLFNPGERERGVAAPFDHSEAPSQPGDRGVPSPSGSSTPTQDSADGLPAPAGHRFSEEDEGEAVRLWSGSPSYWLCQGAGWGSLIILAAMGSDSIWGQSWSGIVVELASVFAILGGMGIGITHAARVYAKKQGWTDLPPLHLVPRAGGAAVLMGGAYILLLSPMLLRSANLPTAWGPWLWAVWGKVAAPLFGFSVVMGAWLAIYFGLHAAWNYRQAEVDRWRLQAQTEAARLKALTLQLNPHFFFNCLASVRALITENPGRAQTMVARLARLLRRTLQAGDEKTVPLHQELSTTETYLQLEKMRFEERLEWDVDVSEAASGRPVPFLLVQTLTENAVKHGIGERRDGGTIQIEADAPTGDRLRLHVRNPGTLQEEADPGSGTGLANARERLRLLFGDEASLHLRQSGPETVTATAQIPRPAALDDRLVENRTASREPAPAGRDAAAAPAR
jgi:LytS/YehU family sensor histidine kinase